MPPCACGFSSPDRFPFHHTSRHATVLSRGNQRQRQSTLVAVVKDGFSFEVLSYSKIARTFVIQTVSLPGYVRFSPSAFP
ncbi:hypothetical protein KCP73_01470 [Salmonella enterica subsp. enterica]|nr:hypothetical protein KCP73_01470 [Salmonella enterica subsp. enterica]